MQIFSACSSVMVLPVAENLLVINDTHSSVGIFFKNKISPNLYKGRDASLNKLSIICILLPNMQ